LRGQSFSCTLSAICHYGDYLMNQEGLAEPTLPCSQCGRPFAHSNLVQIAGNWVCGDCKTTYLSRVMANGAASPRGWHYGGFWIRLGARIIDAFVLGIPMVILFLLFMPNLFRMQPQNGPPSPEAFAAFAALGLTFFLVYFLALICYEVLLLKYRGGTLGKMACGLIVLRTDGSSLGWGVSFGRFFMWNVVTSGIPYLNMVLMLTSGIMAGADAEKRAIHDRVCDTRVIYKQS